MASSNSLRPAALAALLALGASSALATNGYFAHGYGTKAKGMAGAATALAQDGFAGANNPAAAAFLAFLKSPYAHAVIKSYGYALR